MKNFSQSTQVGLKHYVYALVNPIDDKIFYIGKGCGNRAFDHAKAAITSVNPSEKLKLIQDIINKGKDVEVLILRHGLKSEAEAFMVESVLIDILTNPETKKRCINAKMKNVQSGHYMRVYGIHTAVDLEAQYGNKPLGTVKEKLIVININKTYNDPNVSIYDATRKSWVLNKKRADNAEYILSEYKGVIRAVFKMDENKWQPLQNSIGKNQRYYFSGQEVLDPTILKRYINKKISKEKGASNPIKYINI